MKVLALACAGVASAQFHLPGAGGSDSSATQPPVTPATPKQTPVKQKAPPRRQNKAPQPFDYYVLALSWAPNLCSDSAKAAANPIECAAGKEIGFIVDALRPQVLDRTNPESCGPVKQPSKAVVSLVLPLMMSEAAIRRDWAKYGSCTGLRAADYFTEIRQARSEVQFPVQMTSLADTITASPEQIENWFEGANPAFPAGSFRAACAHGALTEVRVCFDANIKPRECSPAAAKCSDAELSVRQPR
jgi:ribonuclease T2